MRHPHTASVNRSWDHSYLVSSSTTLSTGLIQVVSSTMTTLSFLEGLLLWKIVWTFRWVRMRLVSAWCRMNCMDLNVDKRFIVSFGRLANPITVQYTLRGKQLTRSSFHDTWVCFWLNRLNLTSVYTICVREPIKSLVWSAVKPIACGVLVSWRFYSVAWFATYLSMLRWLQSQSGHFAELHLAFSGALLQSVGARRGIAFWVNPVSSKLWSCLESLAPVRDLYDAVILHKLLNYEIDSQAFLSKVFFRCVTGTCSWHLFWRLFLRTN